MIIVTVGSATYKFERLFNIMDDLCEKNILNGNEIFAQTGCTKYNSQYYECVDMIDSELFKEKIIESDIIICHAGVGTITNALKYNKKVIVFPRLEEYNEHSDNHQIEIATSFYENGYIKYAKTEEELIEIINTIDEFEPRKFVSNNNKINDIIIDFIEER